MEDLKRKLLKQLKQGEPYSGMGNIGAAKKKMIKKKMVKKSIKGKGVMGAGVIGAAKKPENPWIKFVKAFAKQNGLTYSEALSAAGPYYKKK